jgi:hypothetical protein
MTQEEIKLDAEAQYAKIKEAESRLKELREICTHENTFEGNWSWRVGASLPAIICKDCGSLVKFKEFPDDRETKEYTFEYKI